MSIMNLQAAPGSAGARHSSTGAECDSPATRFFPPCIPKYVSEILQVGLHFAKYLFATFCNHLLPVIPVSAKWCVQHMLPYPICKPRRSSSVPFRDTRAAAALRRALSRSLIGLGMFGLAEGQHEPGQYRLIQVNKYKQNVLRNTCSI